MGTNYGQYLGNMGLAGWPVTDVSGCILWLDGKDSETVVEYGGGVIGWRSKDNDSYTLLKNSDMTTDWWPILTRMEATSNYVFDGQIVTRAKVISNLDHFLWLLINTTSDRWLKTEISFYIPSGNTNVDGMQIRYGNTLSAINSVTPGLDQWHTLVYDSPMISPFNDIFIVPLKGSGSIFVANEDADDDIFYIRVATAHTYNGLYAYQSTLNDRPTYVNGTIIFNGNDNYLDLSAFISNFSFDTQGEWIIVYKDEGTLTYDFPVSIGDVTQGTVDYYSGFGYYNDDRYSHFSHKQSLGVTDDTRGVLKIQSIATDGTNTYFYKNGDLKDTEVGGFWHSSLTGTPPNLYLARLARSSAFYSADEIKEIIYYNRHLSNKERRMVCAHLNVKYDIY